MVDEYGTICQAYVATFGLYHQGKRRSVLHGLDAIVVQLQIARQALNLAISATAPRTTEMSPFDWPGAADWKRDYSNAALLSKEEIAHRRREFEQAKKDSPKKPTRARQS